MCSTLSAPGDICYVDLCILRYVKESEGAFQCLVLRAVVVVHETCIFCLIINEVNQKQP